MQDNNRLIFENSECHGCWWSLTSMLQVTLACNKIVDSLGVARQVTICCKWYWSHMHSVDTCKLPSNRNHHAPSTRQMWSTLHCFRKSISQGSSLARLLLFLCWLSRWRLSFLVVSNVLSWFGHLSSPWRYWQHWLLSGLSTWVGERHLTLMSIMSQFILRCQVSVKSKYQV